MRAGRETFVVYRDTSAEVLVFADRLVSAKITATVAADANPDRDYGDQTDSDDGDRCKTGSALPEWI